MIHDHTFEDRRAHERIRSFQDVTDEQVAWLDAEGFAYRFVTNGDVYVDDPVGALLFAIFWYW